MLAGAAAGSLAGSGLADSLGRRRAFLLNSLPLAAGPLLSAAATGLGGMLLGRAVTGLGIGLSSALVPLYISEVRASAVMVRRGCRTRAPALGGGGLSTCRCARPQAPAAPACAPQISPTAQRGTLGSINQVWVGGRLGTAACWLSVEAGAGWQGPCVWPCCCLLHACAVVPNRPPSPLAAGGSRTAWACWRPCRRLPALYLTTTLLFAPHCRSS